MISYSHLHLHIFGIFIVTAFICGIAGSTLDLQEYKNHQRKPSEEGLCKLLERAKATFLKTLEQLGPNYPNYALCDVSENCLNVSCRALIGEKKLKAGVSLSLCQLNKVFEVWVAFPSRPQRKWSNYFFAIDNPQRIEVALDKDGQQKFRVRWFIKVLFKKHDSAEEKYFSLNSSLQICENEYESSCKNMTLLNLPYLPLNTTCDFAYSLVENGNLIRRPLGNKKRSHRSSRSASNVEDMHTNQKLSSQNSTSLKIGETCDTEKIFGCGNGATCIYVKDGHGICKCMNNYQVDSKGLCQPSPSASAPTDPPSQLVNNNTNSFSAALGALLSVCILLAIAAAIFFGAKYHVFSRIRNRLPLSLRCWPWPGYHRRSNAFEDNNAFAVPLE